MKALLIASEDEAPLLAALKGQGEIEHVGTLAEGLERLEGVDLVLLAQPLVDAKGTTPVLHLRERAQQVAILVLTATAASRSDRSLLQAGADLVLERQPGTAALRRSLGQAIERRRLLVALHRSRQGVHAIVEQSPDGIAVIKGGRVRYINPQGRRWLKWERDQIVGTPKDGSETEADGHQLEIRATQT
jgi:PAS domain-containing protein